MNRKVDITEDIQRFEKTLQSARNMRLENQYICFQVTLLERLRATITR